jgi:pimeloyl-ACP methyl ester carboxylesterase
VIVWAQQLLDRIAIKLATATVHSGFRRADQGERANGLLAMDHLFRPDVPAAQPEFTTATRFHFTSPIKARWDHVPAPGRLFRAGRDWQRKPAVILLHGWNGEYSYYWCFPWMMRACAHYGVNALAFELPFHGARRPRGPGEINNLISDDLVTVIEGVRHCLADTLALREWLRAQGCPRISLWGYSLGGWLTGLLAAHPDPFQSIIMMNPVANMELAMATLPFGQPVRESLAADAVPLTRFNLTCHKPTTDSLLIMAGMRDLFVPPETLQDLAAHWPKSELLRMKHSHISINLGVRTLHRAIRWLAARA